MKLNEKIIYYRRRARYSQQTLADLMGVSRQSVSKWETGESLPEISKLPQLARLFGVTTDHLLSEEEPAGTFPYEEVPEEEERDPWHTSTSSTSYASSTNSSSSDTTHESTIDKIVSHIPHFLGKLIRLYGWFAGIRIAISGVLLLIFCLIGSVVTGSFTTAATSLDTQMTSMMSGFGGDGIITFYNEDGSIMQDVPDSLLHTVSDGLGFSTTNTTAVFDDFFTPFFWVIAIVGVLLIVIGVALAIYLKPRLS